MGGVAFPIERGSAAYTPWTGDLSQVSHSVRAGLKVRADVLTTPEAEVQGEQPMTIQEAMSKAIEGGYHLHGSDGRDTDDAGAHRECSAGTRNVIDSPCSAGVKASLLDPHFWRVLGLALGWHEGVATKCLIYEQWWREPWHRFIDHLADGHTPEAFFARVPCPQPAAPLRRHV